MCGKHGDLRNFGGNLTCKVGIAWHVDWARGAEILTVRICAPSGCEACTECNESKVMLIVGKV